MDWGEGEGEGVSTPLVVHYMLICAAGWGRVLYSVSLTWSPSFYTSNLGHHIQIICHRDLCECDEGKKYTPNLNELRKPYSGRYTYLLVQKCEENRMACIISVINQAYHGMYYDCEFIVDQLFWCQILEIFKDYKKYLYWMC